MRLLYGRQEFHTMERGQENCYLLTNGLGGFSSCTMIGSNSRNDHAFLMAGMKAPNHRYNVVHRLSERLTIGNQSFWISSQQMADGREEDGYRNLVSFGFEDCPQWRYHVQGVELIKTIGMEQGSNTAAVTYEIRNQGTQDCVLEVTPWFQFVKKGEDVSKDQELCLEKCSVSSEGMTVYFKTNGELKETAPSCETYYYAYDACDGRRDHGKALSNHRIRREVQKEADGYLELLYSMEQETLISTGQEETNCSNRSCGGAALVEKTKAWRKSRANLAGFHHPVARMLSKSAAQFISGRESTGGETILAGFPFFEDWGRDTMIALPGCTLSVKQYGTAKSILYTFMANEQKGLMPNLFPEGANEPAYNTADAALLFINCVYLYVQYTRDIPFLEEAYPVMERIIHWYRKGTDYGIHADRDGLLMAGGGLDQVTWMDVRVGEILPTPRHGKPVEINAYWYNALCIMREYAALLRKPDIYGTMAEQVKASFLEKFWMEEKKCLKDVVSGGKADTQIRCNQIWAVSLPFTMLLREQELQVVQTVFEKLYTPYGLRTLAAEDGEFCPEYGGGQMKRDLAYHQGTVWVFPLGAYYMAYLKVHDYGDKAVETVSQQLEIMECALREGCAGQLPEIYDGLYPSASKGCFAQAWSVGEILRVYEAIELCLAQKPGADSGEEKCYETD